MPRRIVVAINGLPRSGKDTVSQMVCEVLRAQGWRATSISSVDPIRNMLRDVGVPVDLKRPEERRLMAEVKSAFDNYHWWATRLCARQAQDWFDTNPHADALCFAHMREAAAIKAFLHLFTLEVECHRLLVTSPRAEIVTNNVADTDVANTTYDLTIANDGSLEDLRLKCRELAGRLIKEELHDDHIRQDHPAFA